MNLSKQIEQKVIALIDEKKLLSKNDRILIALSGGPDSVFLLTFLAKYSRRFSIVIGALHINHQLRKKAAEKDAKFCIELCERLNIPFYLVEKNINQIAKQKKISIEEAGRLIRYEELEKTAKKFKYNKIATAHIANDNTETVLLNLIKGTGLKGISGIPVVRGKIFRPLLGLSKEEIISYLKYNRILFRTDKSNFENKYERNFIRNEIIPRIKNKLNPNLNLAVLRSSKVFRNYSELIEKKLDKLNKYVSIQPDSISINLSDINKIDKRLSGDFFINQVRKKFEIQLSYSDILSIQKLIDGESSKKINLTENLRVIRDRDKIIFSIVKSKTEDYDEVEIFINQKKDYHGRIVLIDEHTKLPKNFSASGDIEYINGDNLDEKFILRKWKAGDKFQPFGMSGTKKISDYLNSLKISALDKKNKLVLINRNRIVWVVSYRIDDRFKITPKTKKVIRLCLK